LTSIRYLAHLPNSLLRCREWGRNCSLEAQIEHHILVVDDEPDVEALFRLQFRRDLKSGRFTMEFAPSAPEALVRAAEIRDPSEATFRGPASNAALATGAEG
jgi:hypothetical protein